MASMTTRSKSQCQLQIDSSSINECGTFNIIDVKRDGNCLFSTILNFIQQNPEHFYDKKPHTSHQVRLNIVEYMLSRNSIGFQHNWERFYPVIKYNLENQITGLNQYGSKSKNDEIIKQSYRNYMSKPGNFGTYSELLAAAESYGFTGHIFQSNESNKYTCFEFGITGNTQIDGKRPKILLLFTGPVESGHFCRLEPSIAPSAIITEQYQRLDDIPANVSNNQKITIRKIDNTTPTVPNISTFCCSDCGKTYPTNRGLITHQSRHCRAKSSTWSTNTESSQTGEITTQDTTVNDHVTEDVVQTFQCDVCKMSFPTQRGMNIHRNRHAKESNASTANRINATLASSTERGQRPRLENDKNSKSTEHAVSSTLETECRQWQETFSIHHGSAPLDEQLFDKDVSEFLDFLFKANEKMPGPKHPAIKFYRLRQKKKRNITSAQYARSTNPQRTDRKTKQRRRDSYQYDLTQYWFYNQRRKAVLEVTKTGNSRQCKIKMDLIENHFKKLFETPNEKIRESYPAKPIKDDIYLEPGDIQLQIKRISLDTSAGPDRVLARTIRQLNVSTTICSIANAMLRSSYVPTCFRLGRVILADKGDNASEIDNWRPITIFSVVRRVIEKALESVLRTQVEINWNQRGFVVGVPGCHINSRLINACLKNAKMKKKNCVVIFLDVSKAFDRIGHDHISKSLQASGASSNLQNLIMNLMTQNHVTIHNGKDSSCDIAIKSGVPQGAPLSPLLFNIAINFIYDELCDSQYADQYGYKLSKDFDALSLLGFADDQAITGHNKESAVRSTDAARTLLLEIGLNINPKKSQAINICNGQLIEDTLTLSNGETITTISIEDRIRYLGCSFNSELMFDNTSIERLKTSLENLSSSPLLKPDQKLNIINQYIFPTLTYPLQSAPINKIPLYVTDGLDVMIRRTVKEIIGLPMRTNDNLFYAPRRLRGLGLVKASWESQLQHFAIAKRLASVDDQLFQSISDCKNEMESCVKALNVEGNSTRTLRTALRQRCFDEWCNLKYQGAGVIHFQTFIKGNDFVCNKNSLSSSEWTAAIKLNCNYANLNGVPGVESASNLCRKCNRENETIAHVTGSCPSSNQQIIARHHSAKHQLADLLRQKEYECFEEVYAIDTDGRSRFSDIVAFDRKSRNAYIIDPTIRYETSDINQDSTIQMEKKTIYEKCIPFYEEKYSAAYGKRNWSVRGLWLGGRGTVGKSAIEFFKDFKLDISKLSVISEEILVRTIQIIKNHIYSN